MRIRSFEKDGFTFTVIYVDDYVRYRELGRIPDELEGVRLGNVVVLAGKMPSWYAEGILAYIARNFSEVKAFGIWRPPAKKVLITYSELDLLPVNSWIEPSSAMRSFCETGE